MIENNTSDSARQTGAAAKAMADRLVEAGLPRDDVKLVQTSPGITNLVARFRGRGAGKPILLIATTRPELLTRHPDFAASLPNAERLSLQPLSTDDTATLITSLIGAVVLTW